MASSIRIVDIAHVIDSTNTNKGRLCISLAPGKKDSRWNRDLEADLTQIAANNIQVIVCLLEWSEMNKLQMVEYPFVVQNKGFVFYHLQIKDRRAPKSKDLDAIIPILIKHLVLGHNILVHCRAGLGRAGVICACCLCYLGNNPFLAIHQVRERRPGAIQTLSQEESIVKYHNRLYKS